MERSENRKFFQGLLAYVFGRDPVFLRIMEVKNLGPVYNLMVTDNTEIKEATLCWSPGENLAWPARYWVETPAVKTQSGWQAQIPAAYSSLSHYAFMTAKDAKERTVSSIPTFAPGTDPLQTTGPRWAHGALWNQDSGPSAWRLIGPNVHSGSKQVQVTRGTGPAEIQVAPLGDLRQFFALVTNSVIMTAGEAKVHQGLKIELNGNGKSGVLAITLVRNFGAVHQQEFSTMVRYGADAADYDLPWVVFKGPVGEKLLPFDSLRLDGQRPDGSPLGIISIRFLD